MSEEDLSRREILDPRKPIVFIAEDDPRTAFLLTETLEGKAEVVGVLQNTQEAIDLIEQRSDTDPEIDLVITDLGLDKDREPEGGYRVAKAAKQKYPGCEVDLLTGSSERVLASHSPDQLTEKGIDNVFGKPFKPSDYKARIATLTQKINTPRPPAK